MARLYVDVFSDLVCPWCFIGKRRLDRALRARRELEGRVTFRAFQLQPFLPTESVEARPFLARKFGGEAQMNAVFARVTAIGAEDEIAFDFHRMRAPNTHLAHRAAAVAVRFGVQAAAVDALFRAHFEDGADIARADDLAASFSRHGVGMEADELLRSLGEGEGDDEVREDRRQAIAMGVHAVPLFIMRREPEGEGLALTGAQRTETLLGAIDKVVNDDDVGDQAEKQPA